MSPIHRLLLLCLVAVCAGCASHGSRSAKPVGQPFGHAQVARLPHDDGLQYCIKLRPQDLAPAGAHRVLIHSLSAFITTSSPDDITLVAIKGRYPGWDTPGTTIYNQQFSNTNTVWLEIIHEFPLGISCMEVYGHRLLPSRYADFKNRMLVGYSYLPRRGASTTTTKLFSVTWRRYLPQYSPKQRPKH